MLTLSMDQLHNILLLIMDTLKLSNSIVKVQLDFLLIFNQCEFPI